MEISDIWCEKYRPSCLDDVVLNKNIITYFNKIKEEKTLPNILFVGQPGIGKTTLAKHLLSNELFNLKFSVSSTTRKKREGEIDGKDYHFLSLNEFKSKIDNDEFIEYEQVYEDTFYGTLKSEVNSLIENNNIIFDVDVVGAKSLKNYFGDKSLSVFIAPPSIEELENRLISRAKNNKEEINQRINKAKEEMNKKDSFDTILINDDLNKAKNNLSKIVSDFLINE